MSPRSVRARVAPELTAQVVSRRPLHYADGAAPALDRPAHVRAGSALARLPHGVLAVIQDDVSFVALVDPALGGEVIGLPLPAAAGVRQFEDSRGNKHEKLDLEACVAIDGALLAFGSGSTALRERVVVLEASWSLPEPAAARGAGATYTSLVHASELYAAMRAHPEFSGSELNIEGAAESGSDIVFFQRGNGAPDAVRGPVAATARVDRVALLSYLRGCKACPPLRDVVTWDLGGEPRLTFTDGARTPRGALAFLACAEDSPDATRDGPVSAVAIGRLDDRAPAAETAPIVDEGGAPLLDKVEGLAFDDRDPRRAWVVVDRDDPLAPSELLELRLGEGWER